MFLNLIHFWSPFGYIFGSFLGAIFALEVVLEIVSQLDSFRDLCRFYFGPLLVIVYLMWLPFWILFGCFLLLVAAVLELVLCHLAY